jgi:3-oxoacyl-[acyl-carrier-protein] synthase-1
MEPVAVLNAGMVTGVGLSAPATCAAIRCAMDNVQETRFMDSGGEWIMGSMVPMEAAWRGSTKLMKMLASVLRECSSTQTSLRLDSTPVLLCLAEKDRPGRFDDLDDQVFVGVQQDLGVNFHPKSAIFDQGRVGIAAALQRSSELIHEHKIPNVIIAGVDSLLVSQALTNFQKRARLLTSTNSDGFIPGEAAAAILVGSVQSGNLPQLVVEGVGSGIEKAAVDSEIPLRADGLVQAVNAALADAGRTMIAMDYRMTDLSGGQYFFKEAALTLARCLKEYRKENLDIWHPADCIGEVGAAIGTIMLAVCLAAAQKSYAPGTNVLCHLSNEDERRAAFVLAYRSAGAN